VSRKPNTYLAAAMMYRDHAEYLAEWIEFHRLAGVERFFLYDNLSQDDHVEVLSPYVEEGIVVLHEWPYPLAFPSGPRVMYQSCLEQHRQDARWIAFIDLDEFLFSPTRLPLAEVLAGYEAFPGVAVNWAVFGTSGHKEKPPGLVIESYLQRRRDQHRIHRQTKSVVNPMRVVGIQNPHRFIYDEGFAVDENKRPLQEHKTVAVSFARLRVNHYWAKSEAELRRKFDAWERLGTPRPEEQLEELKNSNEQFDDTLLGYAPAVREAIERRRLERAAR
jgi:hypothetical protein